MACSRNNRSTSWVTSLKRPAPDSLPPSAGWKRHWQEPPWLLTCHTSCPTALAAHIHSQMRETETSSQLKPLPFWGVLITASCLYSHKYECVYSICEGEGKGGRCTFLTSHHWVYEILNFWGLKNKVGENGHNFGASIFLPCWDIHKPLHHFHCDNFGYLGASKVLKTRLSLFHNSPRIIGGKKDKTVLFLITGL